MPTETLVNPRSFLLPALLLGACGGPATADTGALRLTLTADPATPILGKNTFYVDLRGKDGAPVAAAAVKCSPWMPAHGHGSTEEPQITDLGGGRYKAYPVTFYMIGDWELRARADAAGDFGVITGVYPIQ